MVGGHRSPIVLIWLNAPGVPFRRMERGGGKKSSREELATAGYRAAFIQPPTHPPTHPRIYYRGGGWKKKRRE